MVGDVPWEVALGIPVRADTAWTLRSARTLGEELWTAGLSGEMRDISCFCSCLCVPPAQTQSQRCHLLVAWPWSPPQRVVVTTQWTTGAWTLTHGGCHPNLGARVAKEDLLSPAVDERAALVQSFSEWLMSHCGQGRRLGRTWTQILSSPQAPSRIQDRNRGCLSPVDGPHHHGASLCPQRSTVLSEGTLPWGTMGE